MWAEGWSKQSIAGCLRLSRKHVHTIVAAFERDGFAGLEDHRTRPADHPANQLSLPFLTEVLDAQHLDPRAGRARLHGIFEQRAAEDGSAPAMPSERPWAGPWPLTAPSTVHRLHGPVMHQRLRTVSKPVLYQTPYATPQLELWDLDDAQWRKVLERPLHRQRHRRAVGWATQLPLELALLLLLIQLIQRGGSRSRCIACAQLDRR